MKRTLLTALLWAAALPAQTLLFSPQPGNVLPVTGLTTWRVICEAPVSQIPAPHIYAVLQAKGYTWVDHDVVMANVTKVLTKPLWAKIVGATAKYAGPVAAGFTVLATWGPVKAKPQWVEAATGAGTFFSFIGPIANKETPAPPPLSSQVMGDFISGTPTGCSPAFVFTVSNGKESAFAAQ